MAGPTLLSPPPSTHKNDSTLAIAPKGTASPASNSLESFTVTAIETRENFQEADIQIISQRFPEGKAFLKDRLAGSTQQRRIRFLKWRQQNEEAEALRRQAWIPERFKHSHELSESEKDSISHESLRWKDQDNFPTPPKIQNSQSHFMCQFCFLSMPPEQTKGDLWIHHVAQDLAPYICLHENCQNSQTSFGTFEAWIKHMKEECGSASDTFKSCPICSFYPKDHDEEVKSPTASQEALQQHIASHLQSLALRSLPPLTPDNDPVLEGCDSPRTVVRTQFGSSHPKVPLRRPVYLDIRFRQSQTSAKLRPTSSSIPERSASMFVPQPVQKGTVSYSAKGQAWRPHEAQNANTETFDVLVVDDNIINQRILFKFLQRLYHTVVTVSNGEEALDAVKQRKYDVILMDDKMPVMDGYEATKKIRGYEQRMNILRTPIVGLTASNLCQDTGNMFEAGMDDYLCKPVNFLKVTEKVLHYGRLGRIAAGNDLHQFLASISNEAGGERVARDFAAKL